MQAPAIETLHERVSTMPAPLRDLLELVTVLGRASVSCLIVLI
jgi:hypothetical protein